MACSKPFVRVAEALRSHCLIVLVADFCGRLPREFERGVPNGSCIYYNSLGNKISSRSERRSGRRGEQVARSTEWDKVAKGG